MKICIDETGRLVPCEEGFVVLECNSKLESTEKLKDEIENKVKVLIKNVEDTKLPSSEIKVLRDEIEELKKLYSCLIITSIVKEVNEK